MEIGNKVVVKSFWGKQAPDEDVDDKYNFWKLIGETGVIINKRNNHPYYENKGEQVLIKFDKNFQKSGLEMHNDAENSLWFFAKDVEKITP